MLLGCPKYDVTVYVPADKIFTIIDLSASESFVAFSIDSLLAYKLVVDGKLADITVTNSDFSVQQLSTLTGKIKVVDVGTDTSLEVSSAAGDITMVNVAGPRRATVKTTIGQVSITSMRMYNHTALLDVGASNDIAVNRLSQGSLQATSELGKIDVSISVCLLCIFTHDSHCIVVQFPWRDHHQQFWALLHWH